MMRVATFLHRRGSPAPDTNAIRIGLIGSRRSRGLGYQNRDIARQLEVSRWLVAELGGRSHPEGEHLRRRHQESFLCGLDWILFAQNPSVVGITETASKLGVQTACIPNWEFTSPRLEWMNQVHLMICPTLHCYRHLCDWKKRYGFRWRAIHVPWPVNLNRFKFRLRKRCRRFLFVNGGGGARARRIDGKRTSYRRKGGELIAEAARLAPELQFLVFSQTGPLRSAPKNVEFRGAPRNNRRLYRRGDVCVQPSHWEGIGLQLLECQAAGLPLVTTDAPPMDEYQPLRKIPVYDHEFVSLTDQPFASPLMNPENLVDVLRSIHNSEIAEASRNARLFVEQEHSWKSAKRAILEAMRI
jgi:glycosyltransferase involved in cell wall biosynthesis